MIPLSAEYELVAAMAARAYKEIAEEEDRKVIEGMGIGQGPLLRGAGAHKAFDTEGYRKVVQGLAKKQLVDALVREAEMRHSSDCNGLDAMDEINERESQICNLKATLHHWKTAAKRLSDAVQALVMG